MPDHSHEGELEYNEGEVNINQVFYPFAKDFETVPPSSPDRQPRYSAIRKLILPTEGATLKLPIEFTLQQASSDGLEIVPFHPNAGYRVDGQDYNLQTRRAKLEKAKHDAWLDSEFPYTLGIGINPESLIKSEIAVVKDPTTAVPGINFEYIKRLRCVVDAHDGYMSLGDQKIQRPGTEYFFDAFFPLEGPPLSFDEITTTQYIHDGINDKLFIGPGHVLRLSKNMQENREIGISFVLTRPQNEESNK